MTLGNRMVSSHVVLRSKWYPHDWYFGCRLASHQTQRARPGIMHTRHEAECCSEPRSCLLVAQHTACLQHLLLRRVTKSSHHRVLQEVSGCGIQVTATAAGKGWTKSKKEALCPCVHSGWHTDGSCHLAATALGGEVSSMAPADTTLWVTSMSSVTHHLERRSSCAPSSVLFRVSRGLVQLRNINLRGCPVF